MDEKLDIQIVILMRKKQIVIEDFGMFRIFWE